MFSPLEWNTRGCFIMISPLDGYPTGHFIPLYSLEGTLEGILLCFEL